MTGLAYKPLQRKKTQCIQLFDIELFLALLMYGIPSFTTELSKCTWNVSLLRKCRMNEKATDNWSGVIETYGKPNTCVYVYHFLFFSKPLTNNPPYTRIKKLSSPNIFILQTYNKWKTTYFLLCLAKYWTEEYNCLSGWNSRKEKPNCKWFLSA